METTSIADTVKRWDLSTVATAITANREINLVGALGITVKISSASKEIDRGSFREIPEGIPLIIVEQNIARRKVKVMYEQGAYWINGSDIILIDVKNKLGKAKFALTGELSKGRECYKSIIKLKGGALLSAVSGKCDYLIVGHRSSQQGPTTKFKKAKQLGIQTIDESKLIKMLTEDNK